MKVCPNCNNTVEDNAIFCDKCGARLPESGSICRKCGTKLPDGSRFCSKCGTPQSTAGAFSGIHAQRLSNPGVHSSNRIFIFILCVVLLLSILILPMFTLKSGYITNKGEFRSQQKYSISLLGENYMPDSEYRDTVNTLSRLAFIFMLAAIIAVVFFLLTNKKWHCLLAAVLNFGILLFYEISVSVTWAAVERYPDKTVAVPGVGSWLCILSAIALIIIVFAEFRNVDVRKMDWKSENQKVSRRIYRPENTIYFVCLFSIGIQK